MATYVRTPCNGSTQTHIITPPTNAGGGGGGRRINIDTYP